MTDHPSTKTRSRTAKRELFSRKNRNKRSSRTSFILAMAAVAALTAIGWFGLGPLLRSSPAESESQTAPKASATLAPGSATVGHPVYPGTSVGADGMLRLAIETFDDERAHYYTYNHLGKPIEFFVLKSADGVVRVAFNACDVCYRSRRGYIQDGDVMVCVNCGSRFPADHINVTRGGCNPAPLERTVEFDMLLISAEDLARGSRFF